MAKASDIPCPRRSRRNRRDDDRTNIFLLPLLSLALTLTACFPQGGDSDVRSGGIPLPARVQSLPTAGEMTVKVFMNDETVPRYANAVSAGAGSVDLEFVAPEGEHQFIVIFDYLDPSYARDTGTPWELARWTSGPVQVVAGERLPLNISEYVFEDTDGDGLSNLAELIGRSNPGNAGDPDPGPDPDPDPDPGPAPDPVLPDGIWRAQTQGAVNTDVLAILHKARILMVAGNLIYVGSYTANAEGVFTGGVDIYNTDGNKLTSSARAALNGVRNGAEGLTLVVSTSAGISATFVADPRYGRQSSLGLIARAWTLGRQQPAYTLNFPVDSNGVITGALDTGGCLYSGNFEMIDGQTNVYAVTLGLSDQTPNACAPFTGSGYSGYASLIPDDDHLRIIVASDARAFTLHLGIAPVPPPDPPGVGAWALNSNGRILRWDEAGWIIAGSAPRPLHGIYCVATNDCWAVGERTGGRAVITRWDGSTWSAAGFANGAPNVDLKAVTCVSSNDCWAVGGRINRHANIVRWDGSAWSASGFANSTPDSNLNAVTCVSRNDCWAVGEDRRRSTTIVHWNGSSWSDSGFSNNTPSRDLNAVVCAARDDCWAVGDTRNGHALITRWNGLAWSDAGFSNDTPDRNLASVSCLTANNCWAVGARVGGHGTVVRWNGSSWSASGFVNNSPDKDLASVHCVSGGCWAVGQTGSAVRLEAGNVWEPHNTGAEDLLGVSARAN